MEERWCLCEHCVEAIRSRGEKIMTRPMDWEDCTEDELENDIVICDWCENEFDRSEMYICD
jgi:hypothetical protein